MRTEGHLSQRTASPMRALKALFASALVVLALAACGSTGEETLEKTAAPSPSVDAAAASESAAAEAAAESSRAAAEAAAESSRAAAESERAAAESSRAAEEAAASKAAEEKARKEAQARIDNAQPATERELALLVKDPDAHIGDIMVVYGEITQFDSATGPCIFRANIAHQNMADTWDYDHNSIFMAAEEEDGTCPMLNDFIADDEVQITATGMGSYSYDTQIGGSTTVPMFIINKIKLAS